MSHSNLPPLEAVAAGRAAARLGKVLIALLWVAMVGIGGAALAEFALYLKWDAFAAAGGAPARATPAHEHLRRAYEPFTVQYINPVYLFFFPFSPAARVGLSNPVCRITAEGYRGAGPESSGRRRLAFLLGGSAAFGQYATHDSTTITGYLNRLQREYFFVNAGVPSWNSTQELARLGFQILEERPQLIVAYDGSNDLGTTLQYHRQGLAYPAGIPESFDDLEALVDDIRGVRRRAPEQPLLPRLLPRLTSFVRAHRRAGPVAPPTVSPLPDTVIAASARKYAHNLLLMNHLARANGARFVGVFQPVLPLHRHIPDTMLTRLMPQYGRRDFTRYRDLVLAALGRRLEHLDFGALFDATHNPVPVFDRRSGRDLTDTTIFVDAVHLTDAGNRRVAEALIQRLRLATNTP